MKYFFFDIDGTLTDHKTHRIVESAKETINKLRENGHFVAIATGRFHYKAMDFAEKIEIDNVVCSGGGCIVINNEIVEDEPLNLEATKELLRRAEEDDVGYLLLLEDNDKVFLKDMKFLAQAGLRRELTSYVLDENLDIEKLDKIYKVYFSIKESDIDKYSWCKSLTRMRLHPNYFVHQHDKKREGILKMMEYLKADPHEVVVFGDDLNDIDMFKGPWFKIAMGNAKEELKNIADYVTDTNINDGIKKACEHFKWI